MIICIPEARERFGLGHIARQCVLTNALCQYGLDARLVVPETIPGNLYGPHWLRKRIAANRVLNYADVHAIFNNPSNRSQVLIDSYDYLHIALSVGLDLTKDFFVMDDLAYQRRYLQNIVGVIPNICSKRQLELISKTQASGETKYLYGSNYVLIDPVFLLDSSERLALLKERQRRLNDCLAHKRSLVLLIGFGGLSTVLLDDVSREHISSVLEGLQQECAEIEVRCIGNGAAALCDSIGQLAHNFGILDIHALQQAYLDADVYIGAIGYSMWERASLLLPSFVVPIAANQVPYVDTGEELGFHRGLTMETRERWLSDSFSMLGSAFELKVNGSGYFSLFSMTA